MDSVAADLGLQDLAGSPERLELPDFPGLPAKDFQERQEVQDFLVSAEVQVTAASRRTVKMFMPISM